MEAIKIADLLKKYSNMWVALNQKRTEVLASADSLDGALRLAQNKSSESPIMTFVPRLDLDYVG